MKTKHLILPVIALCMTAVSSHAAMTVYALSGSDIAHGLNLGAGSAVTTNNFGPSHTATIVYAFSGSSIAYGANLGTGSAATTNVFGSGITASNYTASSPVRTIGLTGGQVRALKSSDTDVHQFTVTIPAGVFVDFTNLSFNYGNVGPDTSPASFTVTSTVAGGTYSPQNTWTHAAGIFSGTANMTLAGNFLSDLTNRTVTFTFSDTAGGNNLNTTMYTFIDNVTLTGTIVPEPSSAALLGVVGMLCLLRRRREPG